jgi:hypothetical protein
MSEPDENLVRENPVCVSKTRVTMPMPKVNMHGATTQIAKCNLHDASFNLVDRFSG